MSSSVVIQSTIDGQTVEFPRKMCEDSPSLRGWLEDLGEGVALPMPHKSYINRIIADWWILDDKQPFARYHETSTRETPTDRRWLITTIAPKRTDPEFEYRYHDPYPPIVEWEVEFLKTRIGNNIFEVFRAAMFYDLRGLINLISTDLAQPYKKTTPHDLRVVLKRPAQKSAVPEASA